MGVGRKGRALARFEIEHVVADGLAAVPGQIGGLLDERKGDAEFLEPLFAAGNALEDHGGVGPLFDGPHLGRHMGQHAVLRGDAQAVDDLPGGIEELAGIFGRVGHGVDADDGIAAAVGEAFVDLGHHGSCLVAFRS